MLRELLVSASRSEKLEHLVSTSPLSRGVVNRFVAGTTTADVIATVQGLHDVGLLASVDRLGEDTLDRAAAEATVSDYKDVLSALSSAGLTGSSEVSVKLSAVGQALGSDGEAIALENGLSICAAAKAAGTNVTFDMEDHTTIDSTLRILAAIRKEFPTTGGVLQAQLLRTEDDVAAFSYQDSRIRLCKGAYAEASDVAYVDRVEIDKAYVRSMRNLIESSAYPMLATHDPRLIQIGQALALSSGRDKSTFEFQMLL